jgi:hypothetical protein
MKRASLVMVALVAGALGACGAGHSVETDASGGGGGRGGSGGGGQARGGTGGGAGTIGGAGGPLGGSGGTSPGRGGAGGSSNPDAATDASDPLACPAMMPAYRDACAAYCSITDAGTIFLNPVCDYGNERCYCGAVSSGGCGCQPNQTSGLCPMFGTFWSCNPVGG